MANKPIITSKNNLKSWFYQHGHPYFSIYIGHISSVRSGNRAALYVKNDAVDTMDDAWDLLEKQLDIAENPGAELTVMVKENPSTSANSKTYFTYPQTAVVAVNGPGTTGISQAQLNMAIENAMLKRDNEDLERELEHAKSPTAKDRIMDAVAEQIGPIIMGAMTMFAPGQVATSPIRGPKHTPAIPPSGEEEPAVNEPQEITEEQKEEIQEKMTEVNQIFYDAFGNEYVDVLYKLAKYVERDPAKAKTMIQFL